MKLINKDALVAEIRSRLHPVVIPHGTNYDDWDSGADSERLKILSFIDTLEVKEVDLEKEIQAFALLELEPLKIYDANVGISITMHQLYQCAKHFFELGLKARQG